MGGPNPHGPEAFFEDLKWRLSLVERRINHSKHLGMLVGEVRMYAGPTIPEGWIIADGTAYKRAEYPDLFDMFGTTYGAGDGSTTFNIPNLKGRVPVGTDPAQSEFNTLGETGGAKTHTLTIAEMPAHSHPPDPSMTDFWMRNTSDGPSTASSPAVHQGNNDINRTGNEGGGGAHNNLQPYIALNFIIFAGTWVNPDPGTYPGITYPSEATAHPGFTT